LSLIIIHYKDYNSHAHEYASDNIWIQILKDSLPFYELCKGRHICISPTFKIIVISVTPGADSLRLLHNIIQNLKRMRGRLSRVLHYSNINQDFGSGNYSAIKEFFLLLGMT
jgi:hypothetical protein